MDKHQDLWANDPLVRLEAARNVDQNARQIVTQQLTELAPAHPWPYGMPTVANPWVVVLGVSPGGSPAFGDTTMNTTSARYEPPTFGVAHPGFRYRDTKFYWDKVRLLCIAVVRAWNPSLSDEDALALSGHLNLGTGSAGRGTTAATDPQVTSWVAHLLRADLRPRVVIGVGLGNIVADASFRRAWQRGQLPIRWSDPDIERTLAGYSYRFRMWHTRMAYGEPLTLVLWPNHPSRHPFAGRAGAKWSAAVRQGVDFLAAD